MSKKHINFDMDIVIDIVACFCSAFFGGLLVYGIKRMIVVLKDSKKRK